MLEYEVITTQGNLITASPTRNQDLYWALSGGVSPSFQYLHSRSYSQDSGSPSIQGGGTYGVVWSVTTIAHPNFPITVGNLSFTPEGVSLEAYWDAITTFQANTPNFTDNGEHDLMKKSNQ